MPHVLLILVALLGADAKLTVPETATAGQPVLVDASESVGDLTWDTADPDLVIFPAIRGGRQAYVQRLKPGLGRFTVTAKDAAGTSRASEVLLFTADDVPEPAPEPDKPTPLPGPAPHVLPDGKFQIAEPARAKASEVKVTKKEQRRQEALELAAKFESIRNRVKSGELDATKPTVMMAAINATNDQLPLEMKRRWSSWSVWWGKFLYAVWTAGKLASQADWLAILEETILGLKAVF